MRNFPPLTEHLRTQGRSQMIDVTRIVERALSDRQIKSGLAIVHVPHTTAAVTINENADPDVKSDMLRKLEELVPKHETYYQHAEGNSDSHVKASLMGNSVTILVEKGKLVLGQWQGVYFCEFDGPRERQLYVKVVDFGPASSD